MNCSNYNGQPWPNGRRNHTYNNNNNFNKNNWKNYGPNQYYSQNSSRDSYRNYTQDNTSWNQTSNYRVDNKKWTKSSSQPFDRRDYRRDSSYRERTDYYRSSSTSRSDAFVGDSAYRKREHPNNSYRNGTSGRTRPSKEPQSRVSETQNKVSEAQELSSTSLDNANKADNTIINSEENAVEKPIESAKELTREQSEVRGPRSKSVDNTEQTKTPSKVQSENRAKGIIITSQSKSTGNSRAESKGKEEITKDKIEEKEANAAPKKITNTTSSYSKLRSLRNSIPSPLRRNNAAKNPTSLTKSIGNKLNITETSQKEAQSEGVRPEQLEEGKADRTANKTYPKIQVRPLAELLKQEIFAVTQEQLLAADKGAFSGNAAKPGQRPTIQRRRQTISNNSYNGNGDYSINDRLANMDKEGLKNIINNSDTIYNEHLKLQARRRLREEIRRQLKEIELDQPKDKPAKELVEDEIVEAIKLPQFLLQEIEKCFGIDISVAKEIETNAVKAEQVGKESEITSKETAPTQEEITDLTDNMAMGNSTDLMERLKVAEQFRMMTTKNNRNRNSEKAKSPSLLSRTAKTPDSIQKSNAQRKRTESLDPKQGQTQAQKALSAVEAIKREIQTESRSLQENCNVIVVVSSSEDEDEDVAAEQRSQQKNKQPTVADLSDGDSDHSNSSSCSRDSTKRRYQQKLESDANNIVDSFDKLILPQLKESLVERYRSSHCANLQSRLHFISCVVTSSEHNPRSFSKIEVAKIQQNLKSNDYRQAIEFLLREIVNVVNLQKQTATARRRQHLEKEQQMPNELISTSSASDMKVSKNAEPASESHQSDAAEPAAATTAQALMPPTPPRNGTPTPATRPLLALPMGLPYVGLDSTVSRLSPGSFSPSEPIMMMGDSVTHSLLEIDRRLLENQNRRGFLEEMIMKFQREKSDLEMLSLELQSRKFLLLNTVIARNQATTLAPLTTVTPTNSPPLTMPTANTAPATVGTASATPLNPEVSNRKRKRRAVVVKRVKILPKRRRPAKRSAEPAPSHAADEDVAPKGTSPAPSIPQPIIAPELHIKEEQIETPAPSRESGELQDKRAENSTAIGNSSKRQHLTRSVAANMAQQTMAIIPPLPPPPPPPEPIANMTYDLPRVLLKPAPPLLPSTETHMAANLENYNYAFIPIGRLHNISSPITQIRIYKVHIIAASENGDVFMFNIGNHKLERQITKHSEAITNMYLCERESFLYTTSLDGFLKKSSLENLERVMQTIYLKEPLQSIDIEWGIAFIGSRWGNIFTYNIAANKVMDMPLLSTGQSIIAVKAAKEGVRKIILLGCKGNIVFLHDAATGLLLRRLSMPEGLNVYSLLLIDGHVFCGTQKNEVYKFDFATGAMTNALKCGNGAVAMASYGDRYLLIGCYDGFIYVLNKETGLQLGRFKGPGRLVLALAIAGDKVVTSSKDNSLEILGIPSELLNLNQSTSD
ncbi:myb-like protein P isoform X2 [Drosophila hydei]|nr:myb-like protein P isoform X2 [Drosophila hydei]